jgi:peptidoglycan/LPS O-acetylase OafA/YrhL
VSDHRHPGTQKAWLPGIEALRGIAALTVVFHHTWSLSSMPRFPGYWLVEGFGNWGVNLFFMLSGFLLADTFWRERPADLRVYAVRRFFRIAPAYYVNIGMLFLFFAGSRLIFSEQGAKQTLASFTFTHYLFPGTASSLNVNGALWTLTIEMMLYAFLPLLAIAVRWAPWPSLVVIAGIGLAWRGVVAYSGDGLREFYFHDAPVPTEIQSLFIARQFIGALAIFALGIGARWLVVNGHCARIYRRLPRMTTSAFLLMAVPSLLLLRWVEAGSNYHNGWFFAGYDFLVMLVMVPALIMAAYPGEFAPSPLRRVSTWLGERSYSIYLWHFPLILTVYERGPLRHPPASGGFAWRIPLIIALTLIVASISYSTIERPGMEWGRRIAQRFRQSQPQSTKERVLA